jgi:uncharacterized membrane protein YraQ (UPF0718 family)
MKIKNAIRQNMILMVVLAVYAVMFVIVPVTARTSLGNSFYYLKEMMMVLPVIFLFTVVIEALVPKEMIIRGFGEKSGLKGNVLALMLGSLSAGPIYAAFPVSKALLSKGASISNIVIILSAWAVIKVPMLANEVRFLGPEFMAVRWVLTVSAIFFMAYLTGMLVKKKDLPVVEAEGRPVLEVLPEYCIGCGLCARILPQCYTMENDKAVVTRIPDAPNAVVKVRETVEKCPGKAIVYHEAAS